MLFYEHLGGKKQNFSLRGLSFTSCGRNVYQSTIIPRTSPTLKVVVVPLHCIRCPKNLSSFSEQLSTSILILLSLLWQRSLSYRKQSIDWQRKSVDCFLHDRDHRHNNLRYSFIVWKGAASEEKGFPRKKSWGSPQISITRKPINSNNAQCLPAFNKMNPKIIWKIWRNKSCTKWYNHARGSSTTQNYDPKWRREIWIFKTRPPVIYVPFLMK